MIVKVHPHVCGENVQSSHRKRVHIGTPPRVWGKLLQQACSVGRNRYTPTCVGKTMIGIPFAGHQKVHPHVCGENTSVPLSSGDASGTPPRVWGKQPVGSPDQPIDRYTPTCVGKTKWGNQIRIMGKVHPHVCGENWVLQFDGHTFQGTPPRVWGKHRMVHTSTNPDRYTPTCVGKTLHNDR